MSFETSLEEHRLGYRGPTRAAVFSWNSKKIFLRNILHLPGNRAGKMYKKALYESEVCQFRLATLTRRSSNICSLFGDQYYLVTMNYIGGCTETDSGYIAGHGKPSGHAVIPCCGSCFGLLNVVYVSVTSALLTLAILGIVWLSFAKLIGMWNSMRSQKDCVVPEPIGTEDEAADDYDATWEKRIKEADAFRKALSEALARGESIDSDDEPHVEGDSCSTPAQRGLAENEDLRISLSNASPYFGSAESEAQDECEISDWEEDFDMASLMEQGLRRVCNSAPSDGTVVDESPPARSIAVTPVSENINAKKSVVANRKPKVSPVVPSGDVPCPIADDTFVVSDDADASSWKSHKVKLNRTARLRLAKAKSGRNGDGDGGGGGERVLLLW